MWKYGFVGKKGVIQVHRLVIFPIHMASICWLYQLYLPEYPMNMSLSNSNPIPLFFFSNKIINQLPIDIPIMNDVYWISMGYDWDVNLVGGLEHFLLSPIVGMMIQSDFHIFQRGWNHQLVMAIFFGLVIRNGLSLHRLPGEIFFRKLCSTSRTSETCWELNYTVGPRFSIAKLDDNSNTLW